ncbi:Basal body P-ring protein [Ewingella americana]|uniref:Basal body P-ring protein n=1 Tax=Ewingella americana TaxID=41202 RepID=A0A377ND99_9GAMM|nr:Basal body P-ring protein [Ewingella americana]
MRKLISGLLCITLCAAAALPASAQRIRDLATIQGVRDNALIGYGLVVGLDGTGDQTTQTPFTTQTLTNMLSQLGITVPPGTKHAAEKRGGGDGYRQDAAVRSQRTGYRRGGVIHG